MNSGRHVTPFASSHPSPSESLPPAQADVLSAGFREGAQKQADGNYCLHCACTVPTRIAPPRQADGADSSLISPILQMKQLAQPLGQGCLTCKGRVRPGAQVSSLRERPRHVPWNREPCPVPFACQQGAGPSTKERAAEGGMPGVGQAGGGARGLAWLGGWCLPGRPVAMSRTRSSGPA